MAELNSMQGKMGRVIGIISVKGGVGKTTVVSNLGASLAGQRGKRVLLVDGNFSSPHLGIHAGVVNPENTLHDILNSNKEIKDAIVSTGHGFDIIAGRINTGYPMKKINPYKLHNRLSPLRSEYDYILIDSSPNLNDEMLSAIIASDELLVVTSPDYPTLSSTMHAVKIAKQRKAQIRGIVLNKVRDASFELSKEDIEKATGVPVISVIDDHIKILESVAKTVPATLCSPYNSASLSYHRLAADIAGEEYIAPPLHRRIIGMFR
jgi:septum site-determining protein MinD